MSRKYIDPNEDEPVERQFETVLDTAFHEAIQHGADPSEISDLLENYNDDVKTGELDRSEAYEWLDSVAGDRGIGYAEEAEHQEGYTYWARLIKTLDSLKNDFALYVMSVDECDECGHDKGYFDNDDKLRCDQCDEVQPL